MALTTSETRDLYRRRARSYDRAVWLYRLVGVRLSKYRRLAVEALSLKPGDTVVEIGCGTGLNFPLLEERIGPDGRIIGVDLTDAMLEQAGHRVRAAGWHNVQLVHSDADAYRFPADVAGVLATFTITLIPRYDDVIRRAAEALRPGGRLVVFDIKKPEGWPLWLVRLAAWLNKPFGVSLALAERHPWVPVKRHSAEVSFKTFYFGVLYLSVGEARPGKESPDIAGLQA